MTNAQIAAVFEEMANLLEFQGANQFRVRAYRNGARAIREMSDSVASIVEESPKKLLDLDGIGKGVAEKCQALIEHGELEQLNELREAVPPSALKMLGIPNLGPKKAVALYQELGIVDLDQLKAACEEGRVSELKGFGKKTEELILRGIDVAESVSYRVYWRNADEIAQAVRQHLAECECIEQLELAGSYRRGRETVGDLDILVVADDFNTVMDLFGDFPGVEEVLVRGDTKMSVRLQTGFQMDLRVVPAESFGAALQYFTGSKEHNVELRGRARQRGLRINEWGVFKVDGEDLEYIAGATEEDVYTTLDLPCFPAEMREARREFEWADAGPLPRLVEESDIRGDLHMHTTATDGKGTLLEMVAACQARGLKYIAITDHSQRTFIANGLDEERLLAQWREIDALNPTLEDFVVLKGIECDILEAGGMDLPDEVLAQADWVIGSIHFGQQQSIEQLTDRIVGAIENPFVNVIAHPTGRKINRREAYELDLDAVFQAAIENDTMLELNSSPARLDLHDVNCAAAKAHGIPIVVSTDAHSIEELGMIRYGILQARRGGLTRDDVFNTLERDQLLERIRR